MVTAFALLLAQGWDAAGHAGERFGWVALVGWALSLAILAVFVLLIAKALVRHRRYRAVDVLSADDLRALHAALSAAEQRTVGEIVPVVLERSDRHPQAEWIAGVLTAVAGTTALSAWLPWGQPALVLACQFALGLVGWGAARLLPDFRRNFVSAARATEMAEEQAVQEFHALELHRTRERTGVLLLVSLLEHRVVVLGDEGIDREVGAERWGATADVVLAGIRSGSLRAGLERGIAAVADVLAERFPWREGDRDEIPDRIVVRSE
jgi:putative membrane protein